jgi:DNA helicase-2/ATP-dependent DNA helicase PcrA
VTSFTQKFNEEFAKLNPAQREAAETIEGPVLIVAGPGTGKTQTLALRLANILQKTQAKPHNLLALTFTEAAAVELKKRLAGIIGSEAYGIQASTFHAFCARIHATFPAEFASTRERVQIEELKQAQLLQEILAAGEFEILHPLRAPDLYLRDILSSISELKREGVVPKRLLEIVKGEEEELAQQERINPRTKKPYGKILDAEKQIARNLELVRVYEAYQKVLDERGLMDFDDLILSVVERLGDKENEFLIAYLQENFLYATVDEFQDTNGAQNALIKAWASYDKKPNLCVVGDDDQSIYRFQGASLANILEFESLYEQPKIITLTQNYRSTQTILDAARSVIERNEERLVRKIPGLSKELVSVDVGSENFRSLRLVEAASESDEAAYITEKIQKLLAAKMDPSEVAVLYRNRKHGDILADFLVRAGVPFFRADGQDALQNPRVRQLIRLLKVVEEPRDALSSLAIFFADFSGIPSVEVYKLAKKTDLENTFLDLALVAENVEVKALGEKLLSWQKARAEQNLLELVENVAAESGLTKLVADKKEYEAAEALSALLSFVRNFAITNENPSLQNLLNDLQAMHEQNVRLRLPTRSHEAVTLTTVHGAKGLEWEHVFVLRAEDKAWGGRAKPQKLKLPQLVVDLSGEELDEKEKRIEDERRLFYVALTRAKKTLTISVARSYEFKEVSASRFIAEIDSRFVERVEAPANPFAALPLVGEKELDQDSRKFLGSLVAEFKLSPTALNNYLACPRKFLFENLLRLPKSISVDDRLGAIFGSAAHQAFEDFFREFKATGQLPKFSVALAGAKKSLDHEPLTKKQRVRMERELESALEKYLEFHSQEFTIPVDTEFNFNRHDVHLEEIPITGKVDRIDLIPKTKDEVRFVDYKSQQPLTRTQIRGETANSTGDLYRQLLFYVLLAELDNRFIFKPREVAFSFVRTDKKGEFHDEIFSPQKEEVEQLKKTIREVFPQIKALKFECSGEADCSRCNFREICEK